MIPKLNADRFENVTLGALVVGPGLPPLNDATFSSLPEDIQQDPIWEDHPYPRVGAVYVETDFSHCHYYGSHWNYTEQLPIKFPRNYTSNLYNFKFSNNFMN